MPSQDHAPHDQSKNGGVRTEPLPTRTSRKPDQGGGGYVRTHTRAQTATPSRERREGGDAPTLIPTNSPAARAQTHAHQAPT